MAGEGFDLRESPKTVTSLNKFIFTDNYASHHSLKKLLLQQRLFQGPTTGHTQQLSDYELPSPKWHTVNRTSIPKTHGT